MAEKVPDTFAEDHHLRTYPCDRSNAKLLHRSVRNPNQLRKREHPRKSVSYRAVSHTRKKTCPWESEESGSTAVIGMAIKGSHPTSKARTGADAYAVCREGQYYS